MTVISTSLLIFPPGRTQKLVRLMLVPAEDSLHPLVWLQNDAPIPLAVHAADEPFWPLVEIDHLTQ